MDAGVLVELARQFLLLSLLSIGGVNALIPEIHRQVVEVHGWMTDAQFTEIFAISQAAPGPNFLVVTLIGFFVAGLLGALVSTFAICGPASLLTYTVAHVWDRFREARWRILIQRALAPITVGLMFSAGYVLTRVADHSVGAYVMTAVSAAAMLWTRIHPLAMLAIAAVLGILGWI
ncbi:MAG TPA: chromate transporter [Casimicrobiaceae bacterium]|nr:chromate transporter [Casimicrobiaceae bacterium]